MDKELICRWNNVVSKDDEVYVLGDFGADGKESSILNQLNRNMPYANLFGHVHDSPIIKTYSKQHYCVSVERINYMPISFDDIISIVQSDEAKGKK